MTPNGKEYVRKFPEQYDEETQEKFMRRVLNEYALEKKDEKGEPSGTFFMDMKNAKLLVKDLIKKVKGFDDAKTNTYVQQYFQRTWEHFDVNNDGLLDANDMTAFCKYFASDQSLDLDEIMK